MELIRQDDESYERERLLFRLYVIYYIFGFNQSEVGYHKHVNLIYLVSFIKYYYISDD